MKPIGIALGSGGARGLAHIGVLDELANLNIHPQLVTGTSIGSIIGAAYASGNLHTLRDIALNMDIRTLLFRFMDFGIHRSGLIEGKRLNQLLDDLMPQATFESLNLPFRCIATDLKTGEEVVFFSGPVQPAIRASVSMPGVFTPARHQQRLLIDGGLVNPVPVDQARNLGAKIVIAVDVNHGCLQSLKSPLKSQKEPLSAPIGDWIRKIEDKLDLNDHHHLEKIKDLLRSDPVPNMVDVLGDTIHLVENQIGKARLQMDPPDILLTPEVGDIQVFDFHHADEIIQAGRDAVHANKQQLLDLLLPPLSRLCHKLFSQSPHAMLPPKLS